MATKKVKPVVAKIDTASEAEARLWADTSVRWLRDHHGGYLYGCSPKKSFSEQLVHALMAMSFLKKESVKDGSSHLVVVNTAVDGWSETWHLKMREYIESGGYKAESIVVDEATKIELEMDDVLEAVETKFKPKSQHSPKIELEEILADVQVHADPRYGVW